jgi:hypothetical protein
MKYKFKDNRERVSLSGAGLREFFRRASERELEFLNFDRMSHLNFPLCADNVVPFNIRNSYLESRFLAL